MVESLGNKEDADETNRRGETDAGTSICLDISLFINGKAVKMRSQDEETAADFIDISRSDSVKFPATLDSISIVAVISLRNPDRIATPGKPRCPTVEKLRQDLRVDDKPLDPSAKTLSTMLKQRAPKLHLREIPNMVANGVHRALSCLVPYDVDHGVVAMLPIRNALHGYTLGDVDVQECL